MKIGTGGFDLLGRVGDSFLEEVKNDLRPEAQ